MYRHSNLIHFGHETQTTVSHVGSWTRHASRVLMLFAIDLASATPVGAQRVYIEIFQNDLPARVERGRITRVYLVSGPFEIRTSTDNVSLVLAQEPDIVVNQRENIFSSALDADVIALYNSGRTAFWDAAYQTTWAENDTRRDDIAVNGSPKFLDTAMVRRADGTYSFIIRRLRFEKADGDFGEVRLTAFNGRFYGMVWADVIDPQFINPGEIARLEFVVGRP
jgi:hypothetical protein